MMEGKRMHKGVLITLKTPVFKQKHKISRTPIYPMFLKELQIINNIQLQILESTDHLRGKDTTLKK